MPKPSLIPIAVSLNEAARLAGVSRARFYEWQEHGLISVYRYNGNRPLYLYADVVAMLDGLPRGSKPIGPLLPPEDRALAKEHAGEPDFAGVFTECFERFVSSIGESEARTRALATTIRAYRRHHGCDYKVASAAVRALVKPPLAASQALADEPPAVVLEPPEESPSSVGWERQ
jgi:hypothetical protein